MNVVLSGQERRHNAIREAWQVSRPSYGSRGCPRWFTRAVAKAIRNGDIDCSTNHGNGLERIRNSGFVCIFDHFGRLGETVVTEPYADADAVRPVAESLAQILGCRCDVSRLSWHYPGWTIRITFYQELTE
ncbi:MAG: hypothetical protein AAFX06_28120 [Planctomycetota bacterium]